MANGDDPYCFGKFGIEDYVRKTSNADEAKACPLVRRSDFRPRLDFVYRTLNLGLEFQTQPHAPSFVKSHRFAEFPLRKALNDHRFHEYFSRNSRNTLSAGSP